jgi:hypothetical protein
MGEERDIVHPLIVNAAANPERRIDDNDNEHDAGAGGRKPVVRGEHQQQRQEEEDIHPGVLEPRITGLQEEQGEDEQGDKHEDNGEKRHWLEVWNACNVDRPSVQYLVDFLNNDGERQEKHPVVVTCPCQKLPSFTRLQALQFHENKMAFLLILVLYSALPTSCQETNF